MRVLWRRDGLHRVQAAVAAAAHALYAAEATFSQHLAHLEVRDRGRGHGIELLLRLETANDRGTMRRSMDRGALYCGICGPKRQFYAGKRR